MARPRTTAAANGWASSKPAAPARPHAWSASVASSITTLCDDESLCRNVGSGSRLSWSRRSPAWGHPHCQTTSGGRRRSPEGGRAGRSRSSGRCGARCAPSPQLVFHVPSQPGKGALRSVLELLWASIYFPIMRKDLVGTELEEAGLGEWCATTGEVARLAKAEGRRSREAQGCPLPSPDGRHPRWRELGRECLGCFPRFGSHTSLLALFCM